MLIFSPTLLLASLFGLLFFGTIIYLLTFKPDKGAKIIDLATRAPGALWTRYEGARGILVLMVFVLFFAFLCISCLMLYALFQSS